MHVCVIGTGYVGLVTGACLAHTGHSVICVDKNAASVQLCATPAHLVADCDALVLATDWPEFQSLDYAALVQSLHTPLLVDGRNCLDPAVVTQAGLIYVGIGRGVQLARVAAPQEAERLALQVA